MTDLWADPDFVLDEMRDNGIARRMPHVGDPIIVYGDRRTILEVRDGRALTDDAAGFRLTRRTDLLWWDGAAWRGWAGR